MVPSLPLPAAKCRGADDVRRTAVRTTRPYRRRHSRPRGSVILWTLGLALPSMIASIAMCVDMARIQMVATQMGYVTQASATAGAWQQVNNAIGIDEKAATAEAFETYCKGLANVGGQSENIPLAVGSPKLCPGSDTIRAGWEVEFNELATSESASESYPTSITVTGHYRVEDLWVLSSVVKVLDGSSLAAKPISRTARVCVPEEGSNRTTEGNCARIVE